MYGPGVAHLGEPFVKQELHHRPASGSGPTPMLQQRRLLERRFLQVLERLERYCEALVRLFLNEVRSTSVHNARRDLRVGLCLVLGVFAAVLAEDRARALLEGAEADIPVFALVRENRHPVMGVGAPFVCLCELLQCLPAEIRSLHRPQLLLGARMQLVVVVVLVDLVVPAVRPFGVATGCEHRKGVVIREAVACEEI